MDERQQVSALLRDALDGAEVFIRRFVSLPDEHVGTVVALWIAHTYQVKVCHQSPRLLVQSAGPGSGKSLLLKRVASLCSGAEFTEGITAAALFRSIDQAADNPAPWILDEIDAWLPKADAADFWNVLNGGWERTGVMHRVEKGPKGEMTPRKFRTFAPLALGGISGNRVQDAFRSRCITVTMKPDSRGDREEYMAKRHDRQATEVAALFTDWRAACDAEFKESRRHIELIELMDRRYEAIQGIPADGKGRSWDRWRPLFAIADHAGGHWPERVRAAYVSVAAAEAGAVADPLRDLLRAVYIVFKVQGLTRIRSSELVDSIMAPDPLPGLEEVPFRDWKLTPAKLASRLKPYEIMSKNRRLPGVTNPVKAYAYEDFVSAWQELTPDVFDLEISPGRF